jgi:hypothetical protein
MARRRGDPLRASVLGRLAREPDPLVGEGFEPIAIEGVPNQQHDFTQAIAQYRRMQGGQAAAWLVRHFKLTLHRFGRVLLHTPANAANPSWCMAALAGLRAHPMRWRVSEVRRANGELSIEVVWLRWRTRCPRTQSPR